MDALAFNVLAGVLSSAVFVVVTRALVFNWEWFRWLWRILRSSHAVITEVPEEVREEQADVQLLSMFVPRPTEIHAIDIDTPFADSSSGMDTDDATRSVDSETDLSHLAAPNNDIQCGRCGMAANDLVDPTDSSSERDLSTSGPGKRLDVRENSRLYGNVDEEIGLS